LLKIYTLKNHIVSPRNSSHKLHTLHNPKQIAGWDQNRDLSKSISKLCHPATITKTHKTNKKNKERNERKKTRKQGKNNGPRPRTKLSTTKPQTLKPSLPTEAAEGKQQHQDHDQRLLRHAAYQKHPYPCDYDSVQRSRTWSPRETSPYPLPPPRAPPKKGLFFHQLAHCESSRHIELVVILNTPKSWTYLKISRRLLDSKLRFWVRCLLGLAWRFFASLCLHRGPLRTQLCVTRKTRWHEKKQNTR
jgi:hypothetical protein